MIRVVIGGSCAVIARGRARPSALLLDNLQFARGQVVKLGDVGHLVLLVAIEWRVSTVFGGRVAPVSLPVFLVFCPWLLLGLLQGVW